MRTSEDCVRELHRRMAARRRMKARRRVQSACGLAVAACLIGTILLAVGISRSPAQVPAATAQSAMASILAERGSLGYVLTALAAFCLGVMVTILCTRLKKRAEDEEKRDGR